MRLVGPRARAGAAGLALTLAFIATAVEAAPDDPHAFVAWANRLATPFPACPPSEDARVAAAIRKVIGAARVVALGEPTHGAQEPLALRNCLFRLLVENEGFTAIAIESGADEARALQDYAAGGPGDPRQLARDHLTWGFGRFAENVELLRWIHDYNAAPGAHRRIGIYGIDMSGGDASGEWAKAPKVLENALSYLKRWTPAASADVRAELEPQLARFTRSGYGAMSLAERARLSAALAKSAALLDAQHAHLAARSGDAAHAWARRELVLAQQLVFVFEASLGESGDEMTATSYRADEARDAAMAANLLWVLSREGPRGRVLLFAHNGHVMNAPTRGGLWAVYARPARSMGQNLRAALGPRMTIILTSSSDAGPGAGAKPDGLGDLDAILDEVRPDEPGFLLDIRKVPASAGVWLSRPRSIRTNYTTEQILVPQGAFDAVLHVRRLTAVRPAPANPADQKAAS